MSLYIHIPYCAHKCPYCDFYSAGVRQADWKLYVDALIAEVNARKDELISLPGTIYFGGGTPSKMPDPELKRFFMHLSSIFGDMSADREITMEVNPDDVSLERALKWREMGINRISIGVQTFDDNLLSSLGRKHSGETAYNALKTIGSVFENVSADLIFALPGQTIQSLKSDLDRLFTLPVPPRHVSVYALMFEPGTAFSHLLESGRLTPQDDATYVEMYNLITHFLKEHGYRHYELSNYALPGYESRHNTGYWTGRPYLGIGPSAHSYDGFRARRANPRDVRGYLESASTEFKLPFYTEEILNDSEIREEYLLTRLRLEEGIDLSDFSVRFGEEELDYLLKRAEINIKSGLLKNTCGRLSLTSEGVMISDEIILSLA